MKISPIFLLLLTALHAQEPTSDRAQLIPAAPASAHATPTPAPKQLEITPDEIISTRTIVRPDQTITIQEVTPQEIELPPLPPPPKPLTPEQIAERTSRIAARGSHRITMLSCTVHHPDATAADPSPRTHIRWTSQDKTPAESYEAWSNINFHHLTQVTAFKKAKVTHNVLFGIGDIKPSKSKPSTSRPATLDRKAPALPSDSAANPAFLVTSGNPSESDLAALDGLHELYQSNHANFIAESTRIKVENALRAAELAANPPDPTPNLLIRFWTPEKTLEQLQQQQAAAAASAAQKGASK